MTTFVGVNIHYAVDLSPTEGNGCRNPYCRVKLGKKKQKTETLRGEVNPSWRQTIIFKIADKMADAKIQIRIRDNKADTKGEILGECEIDWKSVVTLENTVQHLLLPLTKTDKGHLSLGIGYSSVQQQLQSLLESEWKPLGSNTLLLYSCETSLIIEAMHKQNSQEVVSRLILESPDGSCLHAEDFSANSTVRPKTTCATQIIYGCIGIIKLLTGHFLVAITERKFVGTISKADIYLVTKAELIPIPRQCEVSEKEKKYNKLYLGRLKTFLDSSNFFFSYDIDLTNSFQRLSTQVERKPSDPFSKLDMRFFWNSYLAKPLEKKYFSQFNLEDSPIRWKKSCSDKKWIVVVVDGLIKIQTCKINNKTFDYILISRRSCRRSGARYHTRGADPQGNVANFVETEQILQTEDKLTSWVESRGSIPVLWQQRKGGLNPKPVVDNSLFQESTFRLHFEEQLEIYKKQVIVSLIDHKGPEVAVGEAYETHVRLLDNPNIKYIAFDFHEQCKNNKYENLSKLLDLIQKDLVEHGIFLQERGYNITLQTGSFRVNCIDCLDRTNVVQGLLAQHVLRMQLQALGICSNNDSLDAFPDFKTIFNHVWADNANRMSLQYTGVGALKTDYTRTGKRSMLGTMNDGVNSVKRHVQKSFYDVQRQESCDIFLGKFAVESPSEWQQPSEFVYEFNVVTKQQEEVLLQFNSRKRILTQYFTIKFQKRQVPLSSVQILSKSWRKPCLLEIFINTSPRPLEVYFLSADKRAIFVQRVKTAQLPTLFFSPRPRTETTIDIDKNKEPNGGTTNTPNNNNNTNSVEEKTSIRPRSMKIYPSNIYRGSTTTIGIKPLKLVRSSFENSQSTLSDSDQSSPSVSSPNLLDLLPSFPSTNLPESNEPKNDQEDLCATLSSSISPDRSPRQSPISSPIPSPNASPCSSPSPSPTPSPRSQSPIASPLGSRSRCFVRVPSPSLSLSMSPKVLKRGFSFYSGIDETANRWMNSQKPSSRSSTPISRIQDKSSSHQNPLTLSSERVSRISPSLGVTERPASFASPSASRASSYFPAPSDSQFESEELLSFHHASFPASPAPVSLPPNLFESIKIFIGSWNMETDQQAGATRSWVTKGYDIYAIGVRNPNYTLDNETRLSLAAHWFCSMQSYLGPEYVSLGRISSYSTHLLVLVDKKHITKVTNIESALAKEYMKRERMTSVKEVKKIEKEKRRSQDIASIVEEANRKKKNAKTKRKVAGGAIGFMFNDTPICFVNCQQSTQNIRMKGFNIANEYHHAFWFGEWNPRSANAEWLKMYFHERNGTIYYHPFPEAVPLENVQTGMFDPRFSQDSSFRERSKSLDNLPKYHYVPVFATLTVHTLICPEILIPPNYCQIRLLNLSVDISLLDYHRRGFYLSFSATFITKNEKKTKLVKKAPNGFWESVELRSFICDKEYLRHQWVRFEVKDEDNEIIGQGVIPLKPACQLRPAEFHSAIHTETTTKTGVLQGQIHILQLMPFE